MKIILIGASKKARLVLDFLEQENRAVDVIGFADRNPALWNTLVAGKRVLGTLERVLDAESATTTAFCVCLSERYFTDRLQIAALLEERGFAATSLISHDAKVSASATIADGSILFPGVRVGMDVIIGTCVTAYSGALIEHDCDIAPNVEIASRAVLAGGVRVASNAFIGINATVLPNLKIGRGALIGGGAVVTKDVDPEAVVVGNPAHILSAQAH
ncbi:MAG: NeuD/PglB/VioB family sugar acetyltransferase [Chthoniobacterales bacterium]|nr:NeuD/PglB/VioB family sugar acetyltransferase [Chthoniobacterales bacterium]